MQSKDFSFKPIKNTSEDYDVSKYVTNHNFTRNSDNFKYGHFKHLYKKGIYYIKCKENDMLYIGGSSNVGRRLQKHFSELRFERHTNKRMQSDFIKYGIDSFTYNILEECKDDDNLLDKEYEHHKLYNKELLYNDIVAGVLPEELRKVRASSSKATHKTQQYRDKMSLMKTKYRVGQYTKKGKLLSIFDSANDIINVYPDYKINVIRGVCNGSKLSYKGYIWKYIDDNNEVITKNK